MCVLGSVYLQKREPEGHQVRLGRNDYLIGSGAHGRPQIEFRAFSYSHLRKTSTRRVLPELSNPMIMTVTFLEIEKKVS